jgi:hypothetical protein
MFRSSASLMAEDVTVRCRVRKLASIDGGAMKPCRLSAKSSKDDVSIIEMTCTMRNWEHGEPRKSLRSSFSLSNPDVMLNTMSNSKLFHSDSAIQTAAIDGPELLFTPTFDLSPSKPPRSSSNGPFHSSRRISPMALLPYSVPVEEILQVTMDATAGGSPSARTASNGQDSARRIQVTTVSLGCYDIDCLTANGHDIILAFLQGALPSERIVRRESSNSPLRQNRRSRRLVSEHAENGVPGTDSVESSVHSGSVLDIDTLQAKHLQGRAEAETWYEKLQRRVGHIVSTVSDQWSNGSFCDACCQPNGLSPQSSPRALDDAEAALISSASSPFRTSRRIQPPTKNVPLTSSRHGPPPLTSSPARVGSTMTKCSYNDLEIDDSVTECSVRPTPTRNGVTGIPPHLPTNQNRTARAESQIMAAKRPIQLMPSGLSVEPDPYDVESVR